MRVSERVREVWSEKDKIVQRNPNLEERVGKSFELQLSWPKYLWAGHAGCLAISVKYLMDHGGKGPLYIQGVGVSILTFALGFVLAVLGYAALTIVRDSVMDGLLLKAPSPSESLKASYKAWIDLGMSICFLLLGIISFVIRYGSF
jgi:hypothetical protein